MTTTWIDNRPMAREAPPGEATSRTIPFDYSFHFRLEGTPNRTTRETVSVSIEAAFTAVSIGYGVVPLVETFEFGPEVKVPLQAAAPVTVAAAASVSSAATATAPVPALATATTVSTPATMPGTLNAAFGNVPAPGPMLTLGTIGPTSSLAAAPAGAAVSGPGANPAARALRDIRFDDLLDVLERQVAGMPGIARDAPALEVALRAGIRINPRFARAALLGNARSRLDPASLRELFQVVLPPPGEVPFLYALFDEGSGREFQSEPVLSIAGLGAPDGGRPFRYFAHPITFAPRTTIRMDVTELAEVAGDLYVSLHGYKVLGASAAMPRPRLRRARRR